MQPQSMSHDREMIPLALLRGMGLLVVLSLAMVSYARITDRPLEALPLNGPVAERRVLHIFGEMNGSARVLDADGVVVADFDPTEGGFISGVWRALSFERNKTDVDPSAPVRLVRFEDGRYALFDDITGWRLELIGFGPDNTRIFAELLRS